MADTNDSNDNNNDSNAWIGDGSPGSALSVADDGSITATPAKPGTPFHVRHERPIGGGEDASFAVTLLEGKASVGLVAPSGFRKGWGTRGMFYNGNATNGIAALITGLGPSLQPGDEVLVTKSHTRGGANKTEVRFGVNGRDLGVVFSLDATTAQGVVASGAFFPCVSATGGPATFRFASPPGDPPIPGAATWRGTWRVDSFSVGGTPVELPAEPPVLVTLEGSPEPTSIGVAVANRMTAPVRVTGAEGNDGTALAVSIGPLASTRRMPPPGLRDLEAALLGAIPRVTRIEVLGDGSLCLTGVGEGRPELTARPYTQAFEPLTEY